MERPIFIFGCCNSGTTMLWRALLGHQNVSGPDIESQDIQDLPASMRHFLGKATFRLWAHPKFNLAYYATEADMNPEDERRIKDIYSRFHEPGTTFVAKSPADTLRARLIQAYFPDACFIGVVRNGYAVSEGIVRKRKYDPDRPQYAGLLTTIEEAAEQWFRANTILVSHQRFLKKYMILKYEELVADPGGVLNSVLDFCGLEKAGFAMPSFTQSLNEQQISRLSDSDIESITRIAGPMLVHFGYSPRSKTMQSANIEE